MRFDKFVPRVLFNWTEQDTKYILYRVRTVYLHEFEAFECNIYLYNCQIYAIHHKIGTLCITPLAFIHIYFYVRGDLNIPTPKFMPSVFREKLKHLLTVGDLFKLYESIHRYAHAWYIIN